MIRSFIFNQGKLLAQDAGLDLIRQLLCDEEGQIWIDVEHPTDQETRDLLEGVFNFHSLSIEDCVRESERPKVDDYERYIFMAIHAVNMPHEKFETSELNMFIGKNFLVTYHLKPLKSITSTIERVTKNPTAVARAPDRLAYTILDFLFDNYDPSMEKLSSMISELETHVLEGDGTDIAGKILALKRQVKELKMIVFPQRELIARVSRGEFKIVRAHLLPYFRDLLDRLVRIYDLADSYGESLTNLLQVHLNLQQAQVNRIIKVLTVLATLTMPLLIVTSYYGMNMEHYFVQDAPWWKAYAWVLGITVASTVVIFGFLKKMKWM